MTSLAGSLLFMDPNHMDPCTLFSADLQAEKAPPKVLVFNQFSLFMYPQASPSLIGHSTTITSLSHPCCRHYTVIINGHEDMAFFHFCGHCYGFLHRSTGHSMSLARLGIMRPHEDLPPVDTLSFIYITYIPHLHSY